MQLNETGFSWIKKLNKINDLTLYLDWTGRCWTMKIYILVPGAGVEPAHPYEREILSLLCLPISPPGRIAGLQQIAVRILTP